MSSFDMDVLKLESSAGVRSTAGYRVDQAKRLKELEQENGKLKRLVANLRLDTLC